MHECIDNQAQVESIIQTVNNILQTDKDNTKIAILVRSRSHLQNLIPSLIENKIAFNALEIESLSTNQLVLDYLNESDDVGTWQDELLYGKKSKRWFYPKSISNLYDDPNVSFTEGLYRDLNQWIDRMSDEEFAEEIAQANREKKISSPRVNMDLHKALQEIKADSPVPSRGARLTGPGPLDTKLMSILPFGALAGKTAIHTALQAIPLGPLDALEIAVTPEKLGSGQLLEDPEFTDEELIRYYSDFLGPDLGIMSSDLDFEQFFDSQPEPGTPMLDVLGRR